MEGKGGGGMVGERGEWGRMKCGEEGRVEEWREWSRGMGKGGEGKGKVEKWMEVERGEVEGRIHNTFFIGFSFFFIFFCLHLDLICSLPQWLLRRDYHTHTKKKLTPVCLTSNVSLL